MTRKFGTTRVVYLIGKYAIKFPVLVEWRLFLQGLLGNMMERDFTKWNIDEKLCPVIFSVWGGFCNIMPRCESVTEDNFPDGWEFEEWSEATIVDTPTHHITIAGLPVEKKLSSFGLLNGKLVAVDYGSWDRISYKDKSEIHGKEKSKDYQIE